MPHTLPPFLFIALQIITHTPVWVWAIFALLLWLGSKQLRPTVLTRRRVTTLPLVMAALSLWGAVSAFGSGAPVLGVWALAAAACAVAVLRVPLPAATRFDASTQRFHVAGSGVPMALMMGLFSAKYVVGVTTAMHPAWASAPAVALVCAAVFGAFTGVFMGRALRLCRLADSAVPGAAQLA